MVRNYSYLDHRYPIGFAMRSDPRVHARGGGGGGGEKRGWRSKSRSPLRCAVYNVDVSSVSPYLNKKS